ncbi:hypothetical protein [Bradyrhizobium sp. HKCCYLR20261]|uniref:hypothetical protein n=1 Tax=Bradyrhizobium sp. HKCCYLR20261 TaxID=3420760 RepID=UPI003EB9CFC3
MDDTQKSLRFADGKLLEVDLPQWFRKATEEDGEFDDLLSRAGASRLDDYGDKTDTIKIYRTPQDTGYLVIFWDTFEIISLVFIGNVADYMTFRAQYIAPLAQLIMATDQHLAWQEERRNNPSACAKR